MSAAWASVVLMTIVACASTPHSMTSRDRCVVRVARGDTYLDGERERPARIVAACARTTGGAVAIVDDETAATWQDLRSRLAERGIRVHLQRATCDTPGPDACRGVIPGRAASPPEPTVAVPAPARP